MTGTEGERWRVVVDLDHVDQMEYRSQKASWTDHRGGNQQHTTRAGIQPFNELRIHRAEGVTFYSYQYRAYST